MITVEQALTNLATPPAGVALDVDRAAYAAAFPGLPAGMTGDEARRRIRGALAAAEPLIVADVVRRILAGSTATVEWTMRIHYTDGRSPDDGRPMMDRDIAEMAAEGLNGKLNEPFRAARHIDRSEVACREVRALRDGSTLVGPWWAPARQED